MTADTARPINKICSLYNFTVEFSFTSYTLLYHIFDDLSSGVSHRILLNLIQILWHALLRMFESF